MAKICELADGQLIKVFVGLRDRRAQRKAAYSQDDSGDKLKQDKIEVEFLRRMNERDIDSVSARDVGTAYMSTRSTATVASASRLACRSSCSSRRSFFESQSTDLTTHGCSWQLDNQSRTVTHPQMIMALTQ